MLKSYTDLLTCDLCGEKLFFDDDSTVDEYAVFRAITFNTLSDKIEDLVNEFLVYICENCGHKHKYTIKEVEFIVRKTLTKRALLLLVRDMIDLKHVVFDKYLIYCGKCHGFDGKGSCPKYIHEKCEIKRFPINEFL